MSKRSEFNIGETEKTSVKVHNNPGGQSNWSLGWQEEEKPKTSSNLSILFSQEVSQRKQSSSRRKK